MRRWIVAGTTRSHVLVNLTYPLTSLGIKGLSSTFIDGVAIAKLAIG